MLQLLFSDSSLVTDETDIEIEIEIELAFAEIDPSFKVSTTKFSVVLKSLDSKRSTISSVSDSAAAATAAIAGMNAVFQLTMSGCLSMVWGMINGMQLLVHFPIFKIVFPEIPEVVVGSLVSVATFDIPYLNIEFVNQDMFDEGSDVFEYDKNLDETTAEALSNRLGVSTYENRYFCVNMGSVYILLLLALIGLCAVLFLRPFKARLHRVVLKYSEKLSNMLLWNFFIRLILESVLEISFCILIVFINFDAVYKIYSFWQVLDLVIAAFCIIFLVALIIWLLVIMYKYRGSSEKMAQSGFNKNYGSVIEGMKPSSMPLVFPLLFLLRRFSFAMSGMFLYD